jgi:hypothetical protein
VDTRSPGNLPARTIAGTECLIHAGGTGPAGQDIFMTPVPPAPVTITGGLNNPNVSLRSVNSIHRSDSVVTVPVFDCHSVVTCDGTGAAPLPIVGFLQLGIVDINTVTNACSPTLPCIDAVILNAAGLDPASTGTPITGAGTSPVPVRLIH